MVPLEAQQAGLNDELQARSSGKSPGAGRRRGCERDAGRESEPRPILLRQGLDIGYGGDCICENAWSFDQPVPYTSVGNDRQMLKGDCRNLSFVCDGALDFVYSSHLIEDFYYADQIMIIREWGRCLTLGGVLILNAPDQRRFLAHCAATGQGTNENHKEADYSLRTFIDRVLVFSGDWEIIYQDGNVKAYSWYLVARKT